MAKFKMVNGVRMPCTAEDEAFIAQKEADFAASEAERAKVAYLDSRKMEYPAIQDQLLMLWDSMDSGEIPQSKVFYDAIKAINDKYPKPVL